MQLFVVALVLPVLTNLSGNFYVLGITVKRPIMDHLHSKDYNAEVPPNFHSDNIAEVVVQLSIQSFDNVRESSMEYSMTVILRQFWYDDRLKFEKQSFQEYYEQMKREAHNKTTIFNLETMDNVTIVPTHTSDRLELDAKLKHLVWFPDTYFTNERKSRLHDVTMPNELLHIFSNGSILNSMRISVTLTCHMDLQKYPFDTQVCPLVISSYGHTDDVLTYKWHKTPVLMAGGLQTLPTFEMDDWVEVACTETDWGSSGKYSCIEIFISLHRHYGFYIAQIYLPSIMLVVLSWVNFWLDVSATPARVSLGLLCLLTITTMGLAGSKSHLPPVSYMKAIDLWFSICFAFAFGALVEFAVINVIARNKTKRVTTSHDVNIASKEETQTKSAMTISFSPISSTPSATRSDSSFLGTSRKHRGDSGEKERARQIDKASRVLFPVAFCCSMIIYWMYYFVIL